jgi:hypothetical protein
VVGIYSDFLKVLGLDLGSSGSIKIIIKCFVRQVLNFEGEVGGGGGLHITMWNHVVAKVGLINVLNII